jgi:hypothetical protein
MADSFKNRKGKPVPTRKETTKRVKSFTGKKAGRPKIDVDRAKLTTSIDRELKISLRVQAATEDRGLNEVLEDAIRLYLDSQK